MNTKIFTGDLFSGYTIWNDSQAAMQARGITGEQGMVKQITAIAAIMVQQQGLVVVIIDDALGRRYDIKAA